MTITALPQATVRAIGSSQSLVDSAAVVKELIDNALDSGASSVNVEIASNTIDVIQVRDNGHGIPPDDRALLAKRYCTSKITSEQDLQRIKGRSLGFRGEALSHVADMSAKLTVTTQVEGEGTGYRLEYSRDGSLRAEQRTSHAVGTTVQVEGLFSHHPVREKHAQKAVTKTLSSIRSLVQGYALARCTVRFAFSILRSRSDKDRLTYAPSSTAKLIDTVLKVVGKATAVQCEEHEVDDGDLHIRAVMPRAQADEAKVTGVGEYLSIDGRPLTTVRGIGKRILKVIKDHAGWSHQFGGKRKTYFICLQIISYNIPYDVNIEPSKDDVLFEDFAPVERLLQKLLDDAYPAALFDPADGYNSSCPLTDTDVPPALSVAPDRQKASCMMLVPEDTHYTLSEDDEDLSTLSELEEETGTDTSRDVVAYNPWTMAKINSPQKDTFEDRSLGINIPTSQSVLQMPITPVDISYPTGLLTPEQSSPMRPLAPTGTSLGANPAISPTKTQVKRSSQPFQTFQPVKPRSTMCRDTAPRDPERDAWFSFPDMHQNQQTQREDQAPRNTDIRSFMRQTALPSIQPESEAFEDQENIQVIQPSRHRTPPEVRPILAETSPNAAPNLTPRLPERRSRKIQRTKSSMLPLERTPSAAQMQNTSITLAWSSGTDVVLLPADGAFFGEDEEMQPSWACDLETRGDMVGDVTAGLRFLLSVNGALSDHFDEQVWTALTRDEEMLM